MKKTLVAALFAALVTVACLVAGGSLGCRAPDGSSSSGWSTSPSASSSSTGAPLPPPRFGASPGQSLPVATPAAAATGSIVSASANPADGALNVHVSGASSVPGAGGLPTVASTVYHLGGTGAGLYQITDAGTPLVFGCYVCADDGNSATIYCAADSAVVSTAGNVHKGIPLNAASYQPCAWVVVNDASKVYCQLGGQSEIAQCY